MYFPTSLNSPSDITILMISAHPDDQLFWAGYLVDLCTYINSNNMQATVYDLTLTCGESGKNVQGACDCDELSMLRTAENSEALHALLKDLPQVSLQIISCPKLKDGAITCDEGSVTCVKKVIDDEGLANAILFSFDEAGGDTHADHTSTHHIAKTISELYNWQLITFGMDGDLTHACSDDAQQRLQNFIRCHKTQWSDALDTPHKKLIKRNYLHGNLLPVHK